MSRNYDNSVLKGLLRYSPDNDLDDLEDEYDERNRQEKQHYPRGRHMDPSNELTQEEF